MRHYAAINPRFGYRRIHVSLEREGFRLGWDRMLRLWQLAKLQVLKKWPRKRVAASRPRPAVATYRRGRRLDRRGHAAPVRLGLRSAQTRTGRTRDRQQGRYDLVGRPRPPDQWELERLGSSSPGRDARPRSRRESGGHDASRKDGA